LVLKVAAIADWLDAGYDALTDLTYGQMMTEEEYMDAQDTFGMDAFTANIGAEAIREMLAAIDLESEAEQLRADLKEATGE